jgi:hypothetical protein
MLTTSISTGLYPTLDLWNANKLHYITTLHSQMEKKQIFLSVFDFQVPVELNFFCTFLLVCKSLKNSQKTFTPLYHLTACRRIWEEITHGRKQNLCQYYPMNYQVMSLD